MFQQVLETCLRDFGSYWHNSVMQVAADLSAVHLWCESPIPTHLKGARLRFGNCGGHLSCWSGAILKQDIVFKQYSIGIKGSKVCQENITYTPTLLHHHHLPEPLIQGRMNPSFHVVYANLWPYCSNITTEIEIHQIRQCFSNLLLISPFEL